MKNLGTLTLETDRLVIRKFNENDGIYMYNNWASDDKVTKYLKWPTHKTKEMSQSYVNWVIKNYENATTKDVTDLIKFCQDTVFEKFGVKLETEIKFV